MVSVFGIRADKEPHPQVDVHGFSVFRIRAAARKNQPHPKNARRARHPSSRRPFACACVISDLDFPGLDTWDHGPFPRWGRRCLFSDKPWDRSPGGAGCGRLLFVSCLTFLSFHPVLGRPPSFRVIPSDSAPFGIRAAARKNQPTPQERARRETA